MFASVLVPPLTQRFTYKVPDALNSNLNLGARVSISFGKTFRYGYVVEISDSPPKDLPVEKIKPLSHTTHPYPHFRPEQLPFFEWISEYYGHTLAEVLENVIPPPVPDKKLKIVHLKNFEADATKKIGLIGKKIIALLESSTARTLPMSELTLYFRGAADAVKRLQAKGIVEIEEVDNKDSHIRNINLEKGLITEKKEIELTAEQKKAVQEIGAGLDENKFSPTLLHGDTGSGKTEVYLSLIEKALESGGGAIVVVPEIALTPQLVGRMRARLGNNLAVLHSALPPRERWDAWRALLDGTTKVAVGARSALFAPVNNLKLVIVDEEHDASYKQSRGVRYHARDMALKLAQIVKAPCVLGSATPSLETYHNGKSGKYKYIHLPVAHQRAKRALIDVIDLSTIKPWEMPATTISFKLKEAISKKVNAGEQVFILYNRRGFSTYLQCDVCETSVTCPNCSVTLTFHQSKKILLCHYCNHQMPPPVYCQGCAQKNPESQAILVQRGAGTERVYDDLKLLFPTARIDRLDRDSVTDMKSYEEKLERVRDGTTQILVGTQMIAKGHDMPNVTLVGIVDADVGLHFPDFRASERVFQLLTQVAGRSGRGAKEGQVILQTRGANHPSVTETVSHNYNNFAVQELMHRRELFYPPYSKMIRVLISGEERAMTEKVASEIAKASGSFVTENKLSVLTLGPSTAPLEKINKKWRYHILYKAESSGAMSLLLGLLTSLKIKTKKVTVIFDRDPVEAL